MSEQAQNLEKNSELNQEIGSKKVSGLLKIYLFDSFFQGHFVEVNCQGNTNNTGGNGAGKTSLLSLIPIFYGAEPNTVVSREAGKLSFVQYYLPHLSSMICFEYMHFNEHRCALLYSAANVLYYRFVDAKASDLFSKESMEEHHKLNDTRAWLKSYVAKHFFVSAQLNSTIDYRSIIQNGRSRILKNRQMMAAEASRFSLCVPKEEMQHIGALTSIMIRNNRMLDQLKTMLVDSYLGDTIHIDVPAVDEKSVQVNTLKAILDVKKEERRLRRSLEFKNKLDEAVGQALFCIDNAKERQVEIKDALSKEKDLFAKNNEILKSLTYDYQQEHAEMVADFNDKERDLKRLNASIDKLLETRDHYDEIDINEKIAKYESLSEYKARVLGAETIYKKIKSSYDTHVQDFEKDKAKLQSEFYTRDRALDAEILALKENLEHLKKAEIEAKDSLNLQCERELDKCRNERIDEKQSLNNQINELTSRIVQDEKPNAQEKEKLESFNLQLKDLRLKRVETQKSLKDSHKLHDESLKEKTRLNKALEDNKKEVSNLTSYTEDLKERIYPQKGSLQAFMDENVPSWRDNIGLVIEPSLLERKDLNPQFVDEDSDNIFSLKLDYKAIEKPTYLKNVAELEQLRNEALVKLDNCLKEQATLEKSFNKVAKDLEALDIKIDLLDNKITEIQNEENRVLSLKESFSLEVEKAGFERSERTRKERELKQKILGDFDLQSRKLIEKIKERFDTQRIEIAGTFSLKREPVLGLINEKKGLKDSLKSDLKKQIDNLEQLFDASLRKIKLEPKVVKQAQADYEEALAKVREIEESEKIILDYNTWVNSQWNMYDKWVVESHQKANDNAALQQKITECEKTYKQKKAALKDKISASEDKIAYLSNEDHELCACFEKTIPNAGSILKLNVAKFAVPVVKTASEITRMIETFLKIANECEADLVEAVKQVNNILVSQNQENVISKSWEELYKKQQELFDGDFYSNAFYVSCIDEVRKLLDEIIPLHEQTVIESVMSSSQSFMNFYESLKDFNHRVSRLSSEFGRKVALDNPFQSLSDIQIELISKVDEHDIWADLKEFSEEYTQYIENGQRKMPSSSFLKVFERTNDALKTCRISSNLESLVDLRVSMRENGRLVQIRSDGDLQGLSSRGISKLAIIVIFCGLTRYLCPNRNIRIHWPLDELGELHEGNVVLLFELMNRNNIVLFCAQPNPSQTLMQYFDTKNYIDKREGVKLCVDANLSYDNPLLKSNQEVN